MKKSLIALVTLLFSLNAFALSGTTNDGYFACQTEEWFDDLMSFVTAKDMDSIEAYRSANKCIILKSGLRVTILDTTWTGKIQFAFKGIKMWTVSEAINVN